MTLNLGVLKQLGGCVAGVKEEDGVELPHHLLAREVLFVLRANSLLGQ